ncbi:L,D-transpeptidase family protein [Ectothiorhodospiraceae bacterium WFHF3C12]|nr:L,D-transpeptidase family protein [Ectothiorhodospiraceae bacterium WFHF3C12]
MNHSPERIRQGAGRLMALLVLALMLALPVSAAAQRYALPPADVSVIGEVKVVKADDSETILDIGRRHGVGYEEMRLANPGVDVWMPGEGTRVVVPTRYVLPDAPREGIVLNVPEMRLYYYPPAKKGEPRMVETYPVSIGRMDWSTPLGRTRIISKVKDPAWYPPESIKQEAREDGRELPDVVPAGPDNPLGRFAMRLGLPGYLIHSTNRPWGVGMRVTHGCVRMYPEDIEGLFERIPVDTQVRIVNQPYKAGWAAGTLYIESHPILEEHQDNHSVPIAPAVETVAAALRGRSHRVDHGLIKRAVAENNGIPTAISRGGAQQMGGERAEVDVTQRMDWRKEKPAG